MEVRNTLKENTEFIFMNIKDSSGRKDANQKALLLKSKYLSKRRPNIIKQVFLQYGR